jgi:hypothetical protein
MKVLVFVLGELAGAPTIGEKGIAVLDILFPVSFHITAYPPAINFRLIRSAADFTSSQPVTAAVTAIRRNPVFNTSSTFSPVIPAIATAGI